MLDQQDIDKNKNKKSHIGHAGELKFLKNKSIKTSKGTIFMYGKKITSHSIELKIGGNLKEGIFIMISSLETNEILLKE